MSTGTEPSKNCKNRLGGWAAAVAKLLLLPALCASGLWATHKWAIKPDPNLITWAEPSPPKIRLTPPPKSAEVALAPIQGAAGVSRAGGAYESFHVTYSLASDYPAANVINEISSRLATLGWRPLKEDWLNPGTPSSHVRGWREMTVDREGSGRVHLDNWLAQWENDAGDIVIYDFRFSYPIGGGADRRTMAVKGSWCPAAGRADMQEDARAIRVQEWNRRWGAWIPNWLRF
jgi:hypothetical protein